MSTLKISLENEHDETCLVSVDLNEMTGMETSEILKMGAKMLTQLEPDSRMNNRIALLIEFLGAINEKETGKP